MKKNSFTIIEVVIVMTILAIMFVMTRKYFSTDNQIYYAGETCINNFYNSIKELHNASLLSRSRNISGWVTFGNAILPHKYNLVFRYPSVNTGNPYMFINLEAAAISGIIKNTLYNNPQAAGSLGTYSSESVGLIDILSKVAIYAWTWEIMDQVDMTNTYAGTYYLPMRWSNYSTSGYNFKGINWCISRDYFVAFNPTSPYSTGTSFNVAFQTTATTQQNKQMKLYYTKFQVPILSTIAEVNTGTVNMMICNRSVQCKETHRMFFDTRVNEIFLQRCSSYDANQKCLVWQWGNVN